MTRLITVENTTVTREHLSPNTEIQWDPMTNGGQVVFRCEQFTWVGAQFLGRAPAEPLVVPLERVFADTFEVPTESGPVAVPGLLIAGAIKAAFERYFAEQSEVPTDE